MRPITMHDHGRMLRILDRLEFFSTLSSIEKIELIKAKNMFVLAEPGERIIERGTRGNCFYVLISGAVGVGAATGEEGHFATLGPGEVFGEVAFLGGTERGADVVADEQSILFWLGRASMDKLAAPLREKIKDQLILRLVRRVESLNQQLHGAA